MRKIKYTLYILFVLALYFAIFLNPLSSQESAGDIFEKALYLEEGQGELEKAIELYKKILEKYPDIRDVAAKAQLHLGFCYEKLGLREAQNAFQNVVDNYPEQKEVVRIARQKLSRLLRAKAILERGDKELIMRKLFTGKARDFLGSPSPDGQYISTVDWDSGDLAVQKISTGKKQRLTQKKSWEESVEYAFFSRWSPDGKKVVYSWFNEDNFFDLRIIGLDGSSPRIIYRNKETPYVEAYDWSPDGSRIVAGLGEMNSIPDRMAMISVLDGSVRILKKGRIYSGFFSPDGNLVAYNYLPEGNSLGSDVHLISAEGRSEIPVIQHPAHDFVLGWEPDGQRLLFVSDRTGTMDIWMIEVVGGIPRGKPELLKKNMGRISGLGFTKDGSLYYAVSAGMEDVYLASLEYENNSLLAPAKNVTEMFIGANRSPDWSPDGRYLAFISERSFKPGRIRPQVLCILDVELDKQHQLFPELKFLRLIRWSPDGSTLLLSGVDHENRRGLFSVDVQTGKAELILQAQPGEHIFNFDCFPDGKSIVYKKYQIKAGKGNMSLSVRDMQSGEGRVLYHKEQVGETHHLALSSDGEWLAFDDRDPLIWTLNVLFVSGGKSEALLRTNPGESINSIDWKPASREIFFTKSTSGKTPNQLWRVQIEEKEPQRFELSRKGLRELSFHPDGKQVAFTAGPVAVTELWTIENLFSIEKTQNNSH